MEQSKLQRTLFVRSPQKVALLALAVVGVVSPVKAADIVYSLIAANGNFSDTNWAPGSDPTVAPSQAAGLTDNLFFGGTPAFTALNVDLAGASFAGFTFDSDATAFIFAGNGFNLGGDFTNNSAATQTVTNTLTIDAVRKVNTNTGNVVLAGNITGAGGLTKTGSGTLTLKGSNAYTGTTIVNAGS
ncbi:MAG: autotransporter-associated beta strand repeat-containing protein, partial [Tepidisphaeraceae bacterium]